MKPNGLELRDKMFVPDSVHLLLSIDILVNFEDIVSITIDFKTIWNLHVHIAFDWSLGKGHDKVICLEYQPWTMAAARIRWMEPHVASSA